MIRLENVSKFYQNKKTISTGFSKLSLEMNMGEFIAITGESGSGKSTLLHVISGLDSYEEGEMYIDGVETSHYTEVDYENYRRKYIGNIFQHFNLINSYTVYQNVELVLLLNGYSKREIKKRVDEVISTVGLSKYRHSKASKLSGGQKQRVAIARALAKDAPIIVADEPTGNLDSKSAKSIMKLLKEISKDKLVVIVTHNYEQVKEYATRKISMSDGRIVEDKVIARPNEIQAEPVKYKDLTRTNRLLLGIQNAFNIKTKFVLLFLVYFFLTLLVFSEYSSLSKQNYDQSLLGDNPYFTEKDPKRIILKKKDLTPFTLEEVENIKAMEEMESVQKDDLLLDLYASAYNNEVYFGGSIKPLSELDKVDLGTFPQSDDEIVVSDSEYSYYLENFDDLVNKEVELVNDTSGATVGKVKIVGAKYNEDIFTEGSLYVGDNILEKLKIGLSSNYSDIYLTIGKNIYAKNDYKLYYEIKPSDKVTSGNAYVFEGLNANCTYYSCLNKKINLNVKNLYFEVNRDFKITRVLNKDNFQRYTGLKDWEMDQSTIFVNQEDYDNLFYKGDYQISAFLKSTKNAEEVIDRLQNLGYDTYYMKDNLVIQTEELMGIANIFKGVVFIIATVALFFICYFIVKIILKSRNIYFSTIRILGASKKISKSLLTIELLVDINVAYLVFLGLIIFTKSGIIQMAYLNDIITYFKLSDYILVYIVLVIMSYFISIRYAHKLFKDSAMSTYREEV